MNAAELRNQLEIYLAARSASGYRDYFLKQLLQDFVRYVIAQHDDGHVRARTAFDWACSTSARNETSRLAYRLSAARRFLAHLRATFPDTEVPAIGLLKKSPRRNPYIFSNEQISDLLKMASALGPVGSLRPHTYETILGLLASTGMRVGEAIRLKTGEVQLDADPPRLEIRESKFHKSRLVLLHPSTAEKLRGYTERRAQMEAESPSQAFFVSKRHQPLRYAALRSWFVHATGELGMRPTDGRRLPTLHALRHHFAVERLTLWCQEGAPVRDLAPSLSVYLGHVSPAESYWYLTATPALLMTAGDAFQQFVTPGGTR